MADWNPQQYLKFEDERTRPPRELLARVPLETPRRIVDLGCGPGNSTELLHQRFPAAQTIGLDSSSNILRKARERLPDCSFVEADIGSWKPEPGIDLLFGNAVFQWVPDHPAVLRRLLESLPAGGILAVQMPDNTGEPANALQEEVAANGPWAKDLIAAVPRSGLLTPDAYYDLLRPFCSQIDIWHTVYNFVMATPGIVEWFKGSSLQPYLALLDAAGRDAFLVAYSERVSAAYKPRVDGTVLLKFPRLFIVATR